MEFEYEFVGLAGWLKQGGRKGCLVLGMTLGLARGGPRGQTLFDPIHPILLRHPTPLLASQVATLLLGVASDLSRRSD